MIYYVIPARQGSKGLPGKNRLLFGHTLDTIPMAERKNVVVTTDDDFLRYIAQRRHCGHVIDRPAILSNDTASMKSVLLHVAKSLHLRGDDIIVLLYLTYPGRTWGDIQHGVKLLELKRAKSLLCRQKPKTHPYLCITEQGKQIVSHDLYRRQDYPQCWEISHFLSITMVGELPHLNNNLYNIDTFYHTLDARVHDIDTEEDLNAYRTCHAL